MLGIGFTAHTAAIAVLTVHLVSALIAWGHPATFAATVAGLFGVLSVTGRLAVTGLQRRHRITTVVAAVFAVQAIAAVTLPITGRDRIGATIAVIGVGLGFGVGSIAKPQLLADRYDTRRYATIAGMLVVPITIAKAAAPLAAAGLHSMTGGYTAVFLATALTCTAAAVALLAVPATPVRRGSPPARSRPGRAGPRRGRW